MKKLFGAMLVMVMSVSLNMVAFAGTTVAGNLSNVSVGLNAITPYAYPETPTGRVLESEYAASDGYNGASALSAIIAACAPEPFITKAYAIGAAIFAYTGATTKPVYFVSTSEEYAVWDLERENIISYKYYLTTSAYEDAYHRHHIKAVDEIKESLSPMSIE